jgi:hypothetical protein
VKKTFGFRFAVLVGVVSLCILGCGEGSVKPEDSMESTFKNAKKENPNAVAPEGKSSTVKADETKMPAADNNAP